MTEKEKNIVSRLLKMAGDEFSNNGCNDVPAGFWKDWSPEEKLKLAMEVHEWNSGGFDERDGNPEAILEYDWILCSYFASKIKK